MSSRITPHWRVWELVGLALIIGLGGWLRWPLLDVGIVGDEQALLQYHGLERFWRDSLSALHPPLYRMSFRMFLDPLAALEMGRMGSFVAGLALIGLMAVNARRLLGSRIPGLVAALWCAVLPVGIIWSALFRPYSIWMLLVAAHMWTVMRWLEPGAESAKWRSIPVVLTALLLPQVHYMSVPWLAVFGLSLVVFGLVSWRRLWVYLPSALLFLPLCWFILGSRNPNMRRQSGDLLESWERLFGMGLTAHSSPMPGFAWFCLAGLLVMIVSWRRLETPMRVCLLGGLAIVVGVTLSVSQHALTSSTRLLGVVFWIPLMVNVPLLLRRWCPPLTAVVVLGAVVASYCIVRLQVTWYERDIRTIKPHHRLAQFLDTWEDWVPQGYDVGFLFPAHQRVARLVITNTMNADRAVPGCGSDRYCFVLGDGIWKKVSRDEIPPDRPTILVWTRNQHPDVLPEGCTSLQSGPQVANLVRCDPR